MDLNEMRKKFREKKAQEEVSSTSTNVEETAHAAQFEEDKNSTPTKSGESSTVSLSEISYAYEKGANKVMFSCSRLDNTCDETTGLLSICCWISEKTRENGNWQNDNYAFCDSMDLGVLEKGYGFPDINRTFEIPENLLKVINDMNKDEDEWHFIFTINELHEDGNNYIIHTINCPDENEGIQLPMSDDSITVVKDKDENYFAYVDDKEFTGTLYSSDKRFGISFKKSVFNSYKIYHKNGVIAAVLKDESDESVLYDDQGNKINGDDFEKKYGQEIEKIIDAGNAEFESIIENNTSLNNSTSYDGDSVFSKVKSIIVDKLGVDEAEVKPEASFTNDLGADSLDTVELIMEFEKSFGISIPDEIAERIYTVGDAVRLLENNIKQ